jgi:Xaa-Pro aminopeptidase
MISKNTRLKTCASRRRRAVKRAADQKVDAMLISKPEDVSYLCGFTGEDATLLVAPRWAVLITDGRFGQQGPRECPDIEVAIRKKGMADAIKNTLKGRKVRRLGVQGGYLTAATIEAFTKTLGQRRVKTLTNIVAPLRASKDDSEVRLIRKAAAVAQKAFLRLTSRGPKAFVGRSEREVSAELEYLMRLEGADAAAFETILAAGPHACDCHYKPDSTKIRAGQSVLIDWGARVGGYCSDLTRTIFTGKIPPKIGEIYEIVRNAQTAGINALRAGVLLKSPDAAARKVIVTAGYGDKFVHGLGHGLGREVHEAPGLGAKGPGRLRSGMVVTVEPGIYLPGVGGVRIEDDILVTADGPKRLSTLTTDIRAMVLKG